MLGERDRIRNAVGWELDETAASSNNNGVQQSGWDSGIGNVGNVFQLWLNNFLFDFINILAFDGVFF